MKKNAGLWKYLLSVVLLLSVFSTAALAFDVSGTVTPTSNGKRVYLSIQTQNGRFGTSIPSAPGSYTIRGVPAGTSYVVMAFSDDLNTGSRHASDPYASSGIFDVTSAAVTGIDITLFKTTIPATVPAPNGLMVLPSDNSALVMWSGNNNGLSEQADKYNLYWSTSSDVIGTYLGQGGSLLDIPATGDMRGLILTDLTPGSSGTAIANGATLYFAVTAKIVNNESTPATLVTPVTIGPAAGGYSVSGTVNVTGNTLGKPLLLAVVDSNQFGPPAQIYMTRVVNPTSSQSYTVTGVPNGTYRVYAFFDLNGNSLMDAGDLDVSDATAPLVTVNNGSVLNADVTLTSALESEASVRTNRWKDSLNESYGLNYEITGMYKRPVSVALLSGPNVTGPIDIALDGYGRFNSWTGIGSVVPQVNDTYTFNVTYSDLTSGNITASVNGVLSSYATPVSPVGATAFNATPALTWSAPVTPPAGFYGYQVSLEQQNGGGIFWDPKEMSSAATSVNFNFDGSASQTALTDNTAYNWKVSVFDASGNSATQQASFTYGTPAGTPITITTTGFTSPSVNTFFSQNLFANGGSGTYTWSVETGPLPAGLTLSAGGVLSGTPTTVGVTNFSVRATDSTNASNFATMNYNFNVLMAGTSLSVTTTSLPNAAVNSVYGQTINVTGGTAPYTFTIFSGLLPAGMTLNSTNGFLGGTPTVPGTYTFTVQAQDQISATAFANLTLTVAGGSSDISGTVTYSGSKTGRIYITVKSNNGMTFGTSISGPSPYTIRGVPSGNYTVNAFMDALNLGTQVLSAPAGSVNASNPGAAATITLSDPVASAPGQPTAVGASPGDGAVLIGWDGARNTNGVETADSYTVYWNTTAAASKTNYVGTPRVVPAGADSPAIIDGLVNGSSYYFVVVPTSSGIEGTASTVFGPVVVGATTGNNTVSGTVNYSGSAATGPLYVAIVKPETKGAGGVYFTKIASPTTAQSFSVSGIPNGTYEIYAIYDMNNDNLFAYGDVTSTDESGLSVTLTGSGSTGNTISLVSSNANVNITTNHFKNSDLTNESYSVNGNVRSQLKRPVAVVLSGVPASSGLTTPMDLGLDRSEIRFWGNVTTRPSVGDSYTFDVTYSDGSTETVSSQVSAVLDSFPNNTSISGATVSTVPTFTWTAPTTPPASYNYSLWVGGSNGSFWEAWSLPSSQLSAVYGFDGQAAALATGTPYSWNIGVRDQKGNQASINSSFTPTVTGAPPVTPNMSWGGVYHLTKPDGTQWDVIDLGTNVTASTVGTLSATVTGPNGFSYTFTDADIYPYMNGLLAVNKQYPSTAPLSAGVYTFTLDDGQGHVSKRIDTHGNVLSLPIVDSTTIQRQRKADGSYVISWAPVNAATTYNYRVRVQTVSGTPVYLGARSMTGSETIPAGMLVDGTAYQVRVEVSDAPSMDLMFNRSNSAFVDFTPAVADYDANRLVFSYANAYNRFEADGTQQQSFGFGFGNSADALKVTAAVVTGPNGFNYTFQTADLIQPNGIDFTKNAVFSPVPTPGLYTFHVTANGLDHVAYATLTPAVSYPLPDLSTYQVEDLNNGSIRFSWADVNYNGALYYRIFVTDTVTGQYFSSGRLNQAFVDMTTSTFGDLTTKKWRVEVYDSSSGITIRNRVNGPYTTAPLTVPAYDATRPVIGGFGIVNDQKTNGTRRANIWFGASDSDGTLTELRVEGPNGYVRNLLTQGYKDGLMYRLLEAGSPQVGLYKFTAVDNSGKSSVRYNYQATEYTIPNVDFKTFTFNTEPNGDVRISWAPSASNIPVWYLLGASTNTDADGNGQPDALSGTNLSTFLTQSSVVLPASFMSQPNLLFRVSIVEGSNFTTYNNRSSSVMMGYQGVSYNYASLTDIDGDGYASNADANDNDATVYPFAPVASDTTPPTIVSITPANSATNVSINTVLSVKFSEAVDQNTLPVETTFLKTAAGVYITGVGSYDSATNTGTFTPLAPLAYNTTYTGTFSGLKDVAGNTMTSSVTFTFTTAAAPVVDSTPPVTAVSVVGGVYTTAQTVALSVNEAATTYYTTDGTVPTVASSVYSAPLAVTATTTLKFFSKDTAGNSEIPKMVIYKIDSTAPVTTASLAGGTYASAQNVTLSVSEAATTYFTTNGSVPTTASLVYSRSIVIGTTTTLKFFSKDTGGNTEPVQEVLYTIDTAAPVVTVLPAGGSYTSAQSVTLTANESAAIYYTLDGTIPTTASTQYSAPIAVNSTTTVIYFARDAAGNSGLVQTVDYFIDVTAPSLVSAVPVNGAVNVSISTPITLTFSEPVVGMPDLTTVLKNNSTGLYVAGTGTESPDKRIYTFFPNTQLEPGIAYSIQLSTVTDLAGNVLPATTLTFTTKAATATDTTPPLSSASVVAGVYSSVQSVALRTNETARIYYTTDGTTPATSSNLYSVPISISSTTTLKFFAVDAAGNIEPDVNSNLYIMVPSGDVTRDDKVDIADAYRLLQIAVGRIDATTTDKKYGDVGPLVNGIPTPDGTVGIGDVVVLLRRIVGSVTW